MISEREVAIAEREVVRVLPAEENVLSQPAKDGVVPRLALLLCLGFFAALTIWRLAPPETVSASAPAQEFSSERAMNHVRVIAEKARPIGSTQHEVARAHIIDELAALGISSEVQSTTVTGFEKAATVRNVLARLRGESPTRAVVLLAHYDSSPNSPGAADNAAGVATLLETARALKSGPPLKNDLILLFSDAKEIGQMGASAFGDHPWANDVGIVLNFDARGTSGPVFMFETTAQNGWMIRNVAKAVQHPLACSYMQDIYKLLPDSTDLNAIPKGSDIGGLNFAFINDSSSFHTAVDTIQNLDQRSLQQDGLYALSLARQFGNLTLNSIQEEDAVYFDLLGLTLVHYSVRLVPAVAGVIVLFFAGVVVIGAWKKLLTLSGAITGFVALLSSVVCVGLAVRLVKLVVNAIAPAPNWEVRSGPLMLAGLVFLSIAVVSGVYSWFAKRASIHELAIGGLFCWLILLLGTSFLLPGTSYLFAWPLLFGLLPLAYLFASTRSRLESLGSVGLLAVSAIPGVILIVAAIYSLYIGVGLTMPEITMTLVTLLIGLLIPHLSLVTIRSRKRWAFIGAAGVLAVVCLGAAALTSGYSVRHPKLDSVFYGLNADTGEAVWASTDNSPDQWTSQFFSSEKNRGTLPDFFPLVERDLTSCPAPTSRLAPPNLTILEDSTADGIRKLRLLITSPRGAPMIDLVTDKETQVVTAMINGKQFDPDGHRLEVRYFAVPPEGLELLIVAVKSSEPLGVRVADYATGLAQGTGIPVQQRPSDLIPTTRESWVQDSTVVSKSYSF